MSGGEPSRIKTQMIEPVGSRDSFFFIEHKLPAQPRDVITQRHRKKTNNRSVIDIQSSTDLQIDSRSLFVRVTEEDDEDEDDGDEDDEDDEDEDDDLSSGNCARLSVEPDSRLFSPRFVLSVSLSTTELMIKFYWIRTDTLIQKVLILSRHQA
ncbi:hypothetical protein F2P81_024694 [Scophthalmus maximus]|uniref:Uncharacterized protein n=1 Tax=Scophthalmus maximus TaxID=52904 RepID=A0A6A4S0L1_SCOMX|nr:hypothetical protein F2P81_024694 [Scophthalmus maximus]